MELRCVTVDCQDPERLARFWNDALGWDGVVLVEDGTIAVCRPAAHAISVRLDGDAQRALQTLEATGLSRSEAIRTALIETAKRRARGRNLADEVAALDADEVDRAEMHAVAELMESLRAPR